MAEQSILLIALESPDLQRIIGARRAPGIPQWSDEAFHSSDPAIPLNERTDRFVTVVGVYPTASRADIGIVEIREGARMSRQRIPLIRVLGHIVEIRADFGTTSGHESIPVQSLWEIRVDGKTIGALEGKISNLEDLGTAAIALAKDYISRRTAETQHQFNE